MSESEHGIKHVMLAATDLNARARVDSAARQLGMHVDAIAVDQLAPQLARRRPDLLIVDLDEGRTDAIDSLVRANREGIAPSETIGFFSHVDDELRRSASAAGIRAIRRGQFWSRLPEWLQGSGSDRDLVGE